MPKPVIGIMGPGDKAEPFDIENALDLGRLAAQKGYVLLTGGRNAGVMDAALKGAKEAGGLTLGILPNCDKSEGSQHADILVVTGMHSARNSINVLSSDVVIACGIGTGTLSEIALALKAGKPVVLLTQNEKAKAFLHEIGNGNLYLVKSPAEVMDQVTKLLKVS